ncbi:hypothetical protein D3C78_1050840 [compost metagenome]
MRRHSDGRSRIFTYRQLFTGAVPAGTTAGNRTGADDKWRSAAPGWRRGKRSVARTRHPKSGDELAAISARYSAAECVWPVCPLRDADVAGHIAAQPAAVAGVKLAFGAEYRRQFRQQYQLAIVCR